MVFLAARAGGQISYTGGVIIQDFNTLPASGTLDFMDVGLANIKGPAQLSR